MKIIEVQISELIPYARNPRKNAAAVDSVAASIKEFGFKHPIVVDKNKTIICGHTRLLAAQKLNLEKVPCILADDLTEQQIKAFRIIDNKTAEIAEWDLDLLRLEIEDLPDVDFGEMGIEFEELAAQDAAPPESFKLLDENIETNSICPKCGYAWNK